MARGYNLNRYSTGSSMLLQAISLVKNPFYEVIVVGDRDKSLKLLDFIQKPPQPNKVLIYKDNIKDNKMFNYLDFYKSKENGEPLVYVCQNYTCELPTSDIKRVIELLERKGVK